MDTIVSTPTDTRVARTAWRAHLPRLGIGLALAAAGWGGMQGLTDRGVEVTAHAVSNADTPLVVQGIALAVPRAQRLITSQVDGVVTEIAVSNGQRVKSGDRLLLATNATLTKLLQDAQVQEAAAQAVLADELAGIEDERMAREHEAYRSAQAAQVARAKLEAERTLHERGILGALQVAETQSNLDIAEQLARFEQARYARTQRTAQARTVAGQSRATLASDALRAAQAQVEALTLIAPVDGTVAALDAKIGQALTPGHKVLELIGDEFQIEIKIPEAQAAEVVAGQPVELRAANGVLQATVSQVAVAANEGMIITVAALRDAAPAWLRANQSFEARVQVGSTGTALHVVPPVGVAANASSTAWVVAAGGDEAVRTTLRWGRVMTEVAVIQAGASAGDEVLAFPPSGYEQQERFRVRR